MRTILLIIQLLCFVLLFGQDLPAYLPEDTESQMLDLRCLCKPGVWNKSASRGIEISFLHVVPNKLEEEDGYPLNKPLSELSIQNLIIKLRFPIINKEGFKVIGGVMYRPEHYDFRKIGADYANVFNYLNSERMKSSGFEGLITKSLNEKFYTALRLRLAYNGDYSGFIKFKDRYSIFNASAVLGIKKHDHLEYGIGLNFVHSFRKTSILPFFIYNQTFNDRWGLETILPARVRVRYNWNDRSLSILELLYNSRSYAIEVDDSVPQYYQFNHSEIRLAFSLEQRIHPWVWLEGSLGYQYNFSADFEAPGNGPASFQVEPGSSPFFKIGIFISPAESVK